MSLRGGSNLFNYVDIDDVDINTDAASVAVNYLLVTNPYCSTVKGVTIEGAKGSYGTSGVGIYTRGDRNLGAAQCTGVNVVDCFVSRVATGFLSRVGTSPGGETIEGLTYRNCTAGGVITGCDLSNPQYAAPGFGWFGGHINAKNYCFVMANLSQFSVQGATLYMETSGNGTHFLVGANCPQIMIENNCINYANQLGVQPTPPAAPSIVVSGGGGSLVAFNNVFSVGAGPMIRVDGDYRVNYGHNRRYSANGPYASGTLSSTTDEQYNAFYA